MKDLVLYRSGQWICFEANNSKFISVLKLTIKPITYRLYDRTNNCWKVHWAKLPELVSVAKKFNYKVHWDGLPVEWLEQLEEAKKIIPQKDPYYVLYVVDYAPFEVIKGAYEALASKYHPDHNNGEGDIEKLREVMDAYKEILRRKRV